MSKVSLIRCRTYDAPELDNAVLRAVNLVGGMEAFVRPGDTVCIKPNLLAAAAPAKRVTTDPAVVRVVTKMVIEAGGRPFIADSPAIDSFKRVAAKSGVQKVAQELGVEIGPFSDPTPVEAAPDAVFKKLELARQALQADVVINLPKFKTHGQMLLTFGVKNLFGCVVAQRKAEWHYMTGMNREAFASLLIEICQAVRPALTIMDGVWGMEGLGPSNGEAREIGLIAASRDPLALDFMLCGLVGAPLKKFPLYRAAVAKGLAGGPGQEAVVVGDEPADLALSGFRIPELDSMDVLPGPVSALAQRYLVSKPAQDPKRCAACGKCVEICPADAVKLDGREVLFDYQACIRCYCCQEVCPEDAIFFRKGLLLKAMNWLGR